MFEKNIFRKNIYIWKFQLIGLKLCVTNRMNIVLQKFFHQTRILLIVFFNTEI